MGISSANSTQGHPRSVLVVEDDALLRDLIAVALEGFGFRVDTAASAADARRAVKHGDHDAAILDVSLGPGPSGFDLAESLRVISPHVAIVFLTNLPDPRFTGRAATDLPQGVAYLRKTRLSDVDALVQALDAALRGSVMNDFRQDRDPERPLSGLTHKQLSVLALAAQGKSNIQIATIRGVSVKAVEDTIRRAAHEMNIDPDEEGNIRVAAVRRFLAVTGGESPVVIDAQRQT